MCSDLIIALMIVNIVLEMLTHKHTNTQDIFFHLARVYMYPNLLLSFLPSERQHKRTTTCIRTQLRSCMYHLMYLLPPQPFSLWQLKYTAATGEPRL